MSWSLSISNVRKDTFEEQFTTRAREQFPEEPSEGATEQMMEAKDAALALINSGAIGESDKYEFSVYLSGHSNPEHQPMTGWSNDQITVTVSQFRAIEE